MTLATNAMDSLATIDTCKRTQAKPDKSQGEKLKAICEMAITNGEIQETVEMLITNAELALAELDRYDAGLLAGRQFQPWGMIS